ncbi:PREDICTED: pannexin-3 [Nanorana parkeri]|uniref:pannexin-3 n=1 Tax=Nanorana parkeri TaxID=125878 RepID=UPI0008548BE5|nr:PREDICTED: pannexin-3 [Nanorana parkeri]
MFAEKMSIAHRAAEYMLSDALLPDQPPNKKALRLELPLDRIIKLVTVGLPLLLVSLTFAREMSSGSQVICFPPNNFTVKQVQFVDKHCWQSLTHHDFTTEGNHIVSSLWIHKVFPFTLTVIAIAMYIPVVLWRYISKSALYTDLLFIIDELDKSYNRSIKLVQHLVKTHRSSADPQLFWEELKSARHVRYFEYPLLERYLSGKQRSHFIAFTYLFRNILLLLLIVFTCFYLGFFHLSVFYQDEFNCHIKPSFLPSDTSSSSSAIFVRCKLISLTIFQIISVVNAAVYILLVPVILYNISKLFRWDKQFLNIYEMLPAFDLVSKKMLGCPINDLNIIILFLRANICELKSFSRLSVLCSLKDMSRNRENIDTVVDFMTLVVGMEEDSETFLTPGVIGGKEPQPPSKGENIADTKHAEFISWQNKARKRSSFINIQRTCEE